MPSPPVSKVPISRCPAAPRCRPVARIWNLENVDTKSLVDAKVLEGAFIWAPLRIIGATGSPGNPMVLY
jgi:hypothetical protein